MAQFSCSANGAIKLPRQTFTNHKTGGQKEQKMKQSEPKEHRQFNGCLRFALLQQWLQNFLSDPNKFKTMLQAHAREVVFLKLAIRQITFSYLITYLFLF